MELLQGAAALDPVAAGPAEPDRGRVGRPAHEVVCVVGMHRSGTSLITRILNLIGVGLGPDDRLMPPNERDNPTGYWENAAIVKLNDELLEALGGSWDRPPRLDDGWEYGKRVVGFRPRARKVVAEVVESRVTGWKDPRMSLLLPFWQTVVPVTATVLPIRHPFEVVGSLEARDGMGPEEGALLWSRYMVAAWRSHPHRVVVDYDTAVSDPALCALHLAEFLGLDEPSQEAIEAVSSFADPSLRHHQHHAPDSGPNMALALAIYAVIQSQPFPMIDRILAAIHSHWVGR
jgi:hypothetical protein